jgi:ribosomal protein RSM22 (predicted rRNA methylase)
MKSLETPKALLDVVDRYTASVKASRNSQLDALRELFEMFTTERQRLNRYHYLDDPKLRLAYLRYHLPLNTVRSICVLRDILARHPEVAELEQVVDIGAGPGSSSLATMLTLDEREGRRYLMTDRSARAARLAREIFPACAEAAKRATPPLLYLTQKLPTLPDFDRPALVWLSMVLNEIAQSGRRGIDIGRLFESLTRRLPIGSVLAIVEPAQRSPGLRLLELHDFILDSGAWTILAPCTHQKACPLLSESKRPWCHFHFRWDAGKSVERIARPLGLKLEQSAFSFLVLRRIDAQAEPATETPDLARVIGDPMAVRGRTSGVYICRDGKRRIAKHLPKGAGRGDVVEAYARKPDERVIRSWP